MSAPGDFVSGNKKTGHTDAPGSFNRNINACVTAPEEAQCEF